MQSLYKIAGISKQAHSTYMKRQAQYIDNRQLYINIIEEIRSMHPGMSLRRIYELKQPEGIGRDRFIDLGMHEGYRLRHTNRFALTTQADARSKYENLLIGRKFNNINQLWSTDITYYPIKGTDQFWYISLIMDVYSRKIIGYKAAKNLKAVNSVYALVMALKLREIDFYDFQLIHHSDRGSQYISLAYTDYLDAYGIRISMCSNVYENAHIERINNTIKNDYLAYWTIKSFRDLERQLDRAVNNYNMRTHDSLKDKMSPNDFELYLQSIDPKNGTSMKVFTYRNSPKEKANPYQLELQFPVQE